MAEREEEPNKAILALIRGRVQGVGFRYEARARARSLHICGWITNLTDGGVETWAEGPETAIDRFVSWLNNGPPGAHVDNIDVSERKPSGKYLTFTVE